MKEKPPIWLTVYYDMPINWMLISFMTIPSEKQINYFEGPLLHAGDKDINKPTKNYLIALSMSLDIYADFTEDFVGNEKIENKNNCFRNLLIKFEDTNKTYEDFISGNNWEKLRIAARDLLGETELGFYPPPKPIEFDYLVELVDYP